MGKIQVNAPTDVGLVVKEAAAQSAHAIEVQNSLGVVLWYVDADGNISGGGGDVVGPASSTDLAIVRWDGASGALVQDSAVTIDDSTGLFKINSHAALSDPGAGAAGTKFLNDMGQWATVSGSGDVVGPGSATDHALARFDTTTGKLIQNSLVTADDAGSVNIPSGQSYKINNVALTYTDVGAAASAKGVTNGDTHDHSGGDGAQIDHTTLSNIGSNSHSTIDTHLGAASPHSSHAIGIASTTDNRVVRFDSTGGKQLQDSLMTIDDSGSPNIPSGQLYKVNGATISHTTLGDIGSNAHSTIDTHLGAASPHSGHAIGIASTTDNRVVRFDSTGGKQLQDSLMTIDDTGSPNIPSGQTYNINGSAHTHSYGDVSGPASSTDHAIAKYNGTGGKTLENSLVTVADTTGSITINNSGGALIIDGNTAIVKPDGTTTKFARADGTWATPTGSGDVVGPPSSTDNAVARFDGTGGKTLQNSFLTVDDTGTVNIPTSQTYNINGSPHTHTGLVTNGDSHDHSGGDGAQIDHGGLGGLGDDDHSQYYNSTRHNAVNHGVALGGTGTATWTQGNIPYSSSGTTNALTAIPNPDSTTKYLKCSNATAGAIAYEWATPSGTGDVVGPGSATDNAIARFDLTTGKLIQNSAATIADTTGSISINNASGALIIDGNTAIVKPDGTTTKYARADGTWATPAGTGDVVGPASATDNAIARFDTGTGKLIQNSVVTVADSTGTIALNAHNALTDPGATLTGRLLRDDGTWVQVIPDQFKYLIYKSGSTYYAFNTSDMTVTSNSNFVTLITGLITTTGITIKLLPGTYTVGSTIEINGASYDGGCLFGSGRGNTILQASSGLANGILKVTSSYWQVRDICFDGNNQASPAACVGLRVGRIPGAGSGDADYTGVSDCRFTQFQGYCLIHDDHAIYCNFDNLDMMVGNLYGILLNDASGASEDNGQAVYRNCVIGANIYGVKRDAVTATRHRILFERCGFYPGSTSSTYFADFAGVNNLHVDNCDFEATSTPTTAMIGVGGQNQIFTACSCYANGIPLIKSHWGGTNSGLIIEGLQCGGSSTTTLFDVNYNFTVIELSVDSSYTGKWFVSETAKRRCTMIGMPEKYTNNALYKFVDDFDGRAINSDYWTAVNCDSGASVGLATNKAAGVARLTTSASSNNQAVLDCSPINNATWAYSTFEAIVKLDASPTSVVDFVGLYTDSTHYIGFMLDTALGTNWYGVTANGTNTITPTGNCDCADSGSPYTVTTAEITSAGQISCADSTSPYTITSSGTDFTPLAVGDIITPTGVTGSPVYEIQTKTSSSSLECILVGGTHNTFSGVEWIARNDYFSVLQAGDYFTPTGVSGSPTYRVTVKTDKSQIECILWSGSHSTWSAAAWTATRYGVDTLVAGSTDLRFMRWWVDPTTDIAYFWVDDQLKGTQAAAYVPNSGLCYPRASCKTLTTASKTFDIDRIEFTTRRS